MDEGTQRDSRQRVEEHQTKGMSDGAIPETHRGANKDLATFSLLAGVVLMLFTGVVCK
jgi:hypothetical protein